MFTLIYPTLPFLAAYLRRVHTLGILLSGFQCIPTALRKSTTLKSLDLSGNSKLELLPWSIDALAALTGLTSFCLGNGFHTRRKSQLGSRRTAWGLRVAIGRQFPHLQLSGLQL